MLSQARMFSLVSFFSFPYVSHILDNCMWDEEDKRRRTEFFWPVCVRSLYSLVFVQTEWWQILMDEYFTLGDTLYVLRLIICYINMFNISSHSANCTRILLSAPLSYWPKSICGWLDIIWVDLLRSMCSENGILNGLHLY